MHIMPLKLKPNEKLTICAVSRADFSLPVNSIETVFKLKEVLR